MGDARGPMHRLYGGEGRWMLETWGGEEVRVKRIGKRGEGKGESSTKARTRRGREEERGG